MLSEATKREIKDLVERRVHFKTYIHTKDLVKEFQEYLFSLDVSWSSEGKQLGFLDRQYFYVGWGSRYYLFVFTDNNIGYFKCPNKPINIREDIVRMETIYKTPAEVMQALLDGKEVYLVESPDRRYKLVNGCVYTTGEGTKTWRESIVYINKLTNCKEYIPEQWYDKVSTERPILCRVWDKNCEKTLDFVSGYDKNASYPFETINDNSFEFAEPLTQEEVYVYLAPSNNNA